MKTLVTILSVLALLATPALAGTGKVRHHPKAANQTVQAESPGYGTGNVTPFQFGPEGKAQKVITPTPGR